MLEPGGKPLDWKAVARLHPCIVKRLRMAVCWSGYSTNLQEGRRKIISRKKLGNNLSWHKLQSISLTEPHPVPPPIHMYICIHIQDRQTYRLGSYTTHLFWGHSGSPQIDPGLTVLRPSCTCVLRSGCTQLGTIVHIFMYKY